MKIVNVDSYNILIENNLLQNCEQYIETVLPPSQHKKCFLITDCNIDKFNYGNILINSLSKYQVEKIVLPAGEENKSFNTFQNVSEKILSSGITRSDFLIALGGGVIGDLTGFLASTLLRGVSFIQIPTTLLAQVDSSVGGKTAINTQTGKNLIGTFYQPSLVLIDTNTLKTLDERNLKSGYAEIVKYGLIFSETFFEYCEKYGKDCLNLNMEICEKMIEESCKFKANVVKNDPFEKNGLRVLLNLGHTFAHVYEKMVNYDTNKILHGEAVALGIRQAFTVSQKLNFIDKNSVDRIINHLNKMQLFDYNNLMQLNEFKKIDNFKEYLLQNMKKDKKAEHGQYNLVLNKKIGKSIFIKNISNLNTLI